MSVDRVRDRLVYAARFVCWRRSGPRREGVRILLGPGGVEPHEPHTGGKLIASYPWHLALAEAECLI
ncbi:MAG TPA: hypothetical protein VIK45_17690 [Candidatus Dormibacteraeota bacterium]